MVNIALAIFLLSSCAGCTYVWTEQQVSDAISTNRNADWYPVARGTNYAVHTLDGRPIAPP